MNGWAIKDKGGSFQSVCLDSENDAWASIGYMEQWERDRAKALGLQCVPVVIQEAGCQHLRRDQDRCADCGKMLIVKPAQPDIERRMRDDVAALGPVEALRRIKEPKQAGSGEAVAYRFKVGGAWFTGSTWTACDKAIKDANVTAAIEPLYAHPPASADEGMVTAAANAIELLRQEAESIRSSNEVRVEGHPRYGTFDSDQYGEMAKEDFERLTAAADALAKTHGLSS